MRRSTLATLLTCAAAAATAQAPPLPSGLRLKLSADLGVVAPADAAARPAAAPADEGLARLVAQPQRCAEAEPAAAGAALTLAAVVQAAVCHNAGVRRGEGLATQARAALGQADAARQPALNLNVRVDAESGYPNSSATSARLDWVLFDFGNRGAALRQARQGLAAVLDEQRIEVLNAVADAAQLFAAAQAAFGRFDAAAVNLRTAQDSARMTDARHAAGAGTLVEKLQAQTALAQARFEHARVMSQWQAAAGALAVAMGLPASQSPGVVLADDGSAADAVQAVDTASLIDEARERHPRIAAARLRLDEARARAAAVRAERWGNVALSARFGRTLSSGDSSSQSGRSASVQYSLPLFDRGVQDARAGDAAGQVQLRLAGVDDALAQVELQVWQQAQALLGEQDTLRYSRAVQGSAEAALRVAVERYRQGVGGFADVLSAQTTAANARFQSVESEANLRRAKLRLAAAVGRFGPLPGG